MFPELPTGFPTGCACRQPTALPTPQGCGQARGLPWKTPMDNSYLVLGGAAPPGLTSSRTGLACTPCLADREKFFCFLCEAHRRDCPGNWRFCLERSPLGSTFSGISEIRKNGVFRTFWHLKILPFPKQDKGLTPFGVQPGYSAPQCGSLF